MHKRMIGAALAGAMTVSGCATEGTLDASGQPMSEVQKAQRNCQMAMVGGALLGAALGAAASNNRNRATGAAIGGGAGALVGAGFCGVMMATANEKDRQHIAEARRIALETGQTQRQQYAGEDGKLRVIQVTASDVPLASSGFAKTEEFTFCRAINTEVAVQASGNAHLGEVACRKMDGTYVTRSLPRT